MNIPVYFLVRGWNALSYFDLCVGSIFKQTYRDYTIIYIDDASPYTKQQKKYISDRLKGHIVQFNKTRQYALKNAYDAIYKYIYNPDAIIINLDGDDWLLRNDVIDIVLATYARGGCDFTYGNCLYHNPGHPWNGKIATDVHPFANKRYPKIVEKNKSFRREYFYPLHLRTWRSSIFKKIPMSSFVYPDGRWIRFGEDQAIFYPLFELSGRYEVISTPLSIYNMETPHSDDKIYKVQRLCDEVYIRRKYGV